MKKRTIAGLMAVVIIASVVIFTGCVEKEEGVTPSTPTPTPTPKTELSLGESTVVDGISFTILGYEFTDSYSRCEYNRGETFYPAEGAKFLWVHVKARNVGEVAQNTPSKYDMGLLYKGTEIKCRSTCGIWGELLERKTYHGNERIYPAVSEEGWILYEVPKGIIISQAKICVDVEEGKTMTWSLTS